MKLSQVHAQGPYAIKLTVCPAIGCLVKTSGMMEFLILQIMGFKSTNLPLMAVKQTANQKIYNFYYPRDTPGKFVDSGHEIETKLEFTEA